MGQFDYNRGPVPEHDLFLAWARLGEDDKLRALQHLATLLPKSMQYDLAAYIGAGDVFVRPSIMEALGSDPEPTTPDLIKDYENKVRPSYATSKRTPKWGKFATYILAAMVVATVLVAIWHVFFPGGSL